MKRHVTWPTYVCWLHLQTVVVSRILRFLGTSWCPGFGRLLASTDLLCMAPRTWNWLTTPLWLPTPELSLSCSRPTSSSTKLVLAAATHVIYRWVNILSLTHAQMSFRRHNNICFLQQTCTHTHTRLMALFLGLQCFVCLQCFDAVGWAAGRASGL